MLHENRIARLAQSKDAYVKDVYTFMQKSGTLQTIAGDSVPVLRLSSKAVDEIAQTQRQQTSNDADHHVFPRNAFFEQSRRMCVFDRRKNTQEFIILYHLRDKADHVCAEHQQQRDTATGTAARDERREKEPDRIEEQQH